MTALVVIAVVVVLLILVVLVDHVGRIADGLGRLALVAEAEERRRDELERDLRAIR